MQVLVDASVWSDYFAGIATPRIGYLDEILGRTPIVVADLVDAEVLQGYADEAQLRAAHGALQRSPLHEIGGSALWAPAGVSRRRIYSHPSI